MQKSNLRTITLKITGSMVLAFCFISTAEAQLLHKVQDVQQAQEPQQAAQEAPVTKEAAPAVVAETVAAPAAVEEKAVEQQTPVKQVSGNKKPTGAFTIDDLKAMAEEAAASQPSADQLKGGFDPMKYTLGPDDVVEITVMRHPEFSGIYPINQEGKLQYKFVGDMLVTGMTKFQLEEKITEIVSKFVIAPEVNVTVTDYKSKVFYVLGEVGSPGKYYMRSETISVRDAVVMAGLPTQAAAMRKTRIITPNQRGGIVRSVDIYALLYGGDLKKNLIMKPGDFLYVPSTIMAKVFRVISPASSAVATAVSPVSSVAAAQNDSSAARGNNNR